VTVLSWPPCSPDLNIIENIWPILAQTDYDGKSIKNFSELEMSIKKAVFKFNENYRSHNFNNSVSSRLLSVIIKHGDRIKY